MRHQKKRYSVPRSKYAKILLKTKLKFLRKIITEGYSIKDSATIYDINYSTAKTLMRQYRAASWEFDLELPLQESPPEWDGYQKRVRCGYCSLEEWKESAQVSESSRSSNSGGAESSLCSNSAKVGRIAFAKQIEVISSTSFD